MMAIYERQVNAAEKVIVVFERNQWRVKKLLCGKEQYQYIVNSEEEALAYLERMSK